MNVRPLIQLGEALSGLAWVQGPGGNLSVKDATTLVVKASGTRLGEMAAAGALARVPMGQANAALTGDPEAMTAIFQHTPRPSLETWLHALPGRYIAHTHPLGVLLVACSRSAPPPGMADVPAALPGRDLALALQGAGAVDAWLLRNHGLVVRASSARAALQQTRRLDAACRARFAVQPRDLPRLPVLAPRDVKGGVVMAIHGLAEATARYLFPDAAVLAAQTAVAELSEATAAAKLADDPRPGLLVAPDGQRWAVARHVGQLRDVLEVVTAHDWLLQRLGDDAVALPAAMTAAILDMPAERFRQLGVAS